eukprot:1176689-Prorocentrum_minimum.AAC.5
MSLRSRRTHVGLDAHTRRPDPSAYSRGVPQGPWLLSVGRLTDHPPGRRFRATKTLRSGFEFRTFNDSIRQKNAARLSVPTVFSQLCLANLLDAMQLTGVVANTDAKAINGRCSKHGRYDYRETAYLGNTWAQASDSAPGQQCPCQRVCATLSVQVGAMFTRLV